MYFIDRLSLGKQLAAQYAQLKKTDSVLVCLKDASLLTAISMAIELSAWVYPLECEKIPDPRDATKTLGAVTTDGEFCLNPAISEYEYKEIEMDFFGVIEDRKRDAVSNLNSRLMDDGAPFDKHLLNGRSVVLVGDIITTALELEIVMTLMKPLRPVAVYGCVGNSTVDVSDLFRISTNHSVVLDVLPNIMDDDHYFEQRDAYSPDEKRRLARNIQTYWSTA